MQTIKYFKTLELIHFQLNSQGGQAKAKEGRMLSPAPLKETLPKYILVNSYQGS